MPITLDDVPVIETSEDMENLQPKTQREHLIVMYQAQIAMLKRQEEFNGFRKDCEDTFQDIQGKVGKLEGATLGIIGTLVAAAGIWAIERILGA